jgi:hypothetical protein
VQRRVKRRRRRQKAVEGDLCAPGEKGWNRGKETMVFTF